MEQLFEEQSIINDINGILSWDMATYMPKNSRNQRSKQINKLYDYKEKVFLEIKKKELFKKVDIKNLDSLNKSNFDLMKNRFEYFDTIPYSVIKKKTELSIETEGLWREAKLKSNFNIVKKSFKKLIELVREEAEILSQKKNISKYDCLLLNYDRSISTKKLKEIFWKVEKFIKKKLPLILKKQTNLTHLDLEENLSENEQFELSNIFMKKLGFNFSKGRIDKSMHPFCGGNSEDIRITTRFDKNSSFSCFDALMHETGHALYEQGLPKKWQHQPLGNAGGMSLHESQSLFIEMQVIRSLPVSIFIEKVLREKLGKKSKSWNYQNIYNTRKRISETNIRVDADEVHYPLHVIHRFIMERKIIEDNLSIDELPDLWNQEFYKLFNRKVFKDNEGCLQDIHWFGGDIGYFPTYSIGAFIASQLYSCIEKELPNLEDLLKKGNFKSVIKWLNSNIHQFGSHYKIDSLLRKITGENLNLKYFQNHIEDRYLKEKK